MIENNICECKIPPFAKENKGAAFYWRIRNIKHARMLAIIDMLSEYELHYTQPPVLGMISRLNGPTQKELADAMNTSPAAMSATVKRLQKSGLVQKQTIEEDTRKNQILLTEKGKQVNADTFDKILQIDKELLQGFKEDEIQTLFCYLDRIQENAIALRKGESND